MLFLCTYISLFVCSTSHISLQYFEKTARNVKVLYQNKLTKKKPSLMLRYLDADLLNTLFGLGIFGLLLA